MNTPIPTKRVRGLAIDAAVRRILLCSHPEVSDAEIQHRGETWVGDGEFTAYFDGKPVARVKIKADNKFTLTIL